MKNVGMFGAERHRSRRPSVATSRFTSKSHSEPQDISIERYNASTENQSHIKRHKHNTDRSTYHLKSKRAIVRAQNTRTSCEVEMCWRGHVNMSPA